MRIQLKALAPTTRGIYTVSGKGPGSMPDRALFLEPSCAQAFWTMEADTGGLIYTDCYRTPLESLVAMRKKTGVQPPGFSGHNFGFSFDVAVAETIIDKGWSYAQLLGRLQEHGWYCFRQDGAGGYNQSESWHFNCFGAEASMYMLGTSHAWAVPLERKIQAVYGQAFLLNDFEIQENLKRLHMYPGAIDGILGPVSQEGTRMFQRAWGLEETGVPDDRMRRVLAVVGADFVYL